MKTIYYTPTNYPSDLTDKQWEAIEGFFPVGNKSTTHKRSLTEAVLYLIDNGCKWRALPHDYPNWSTVKSFYYRAVESGLWAEIMQFLVSKSRINAGRNENPSYGLIDSQSVKTIYASEECGIDGGKKRKGENDIS
jgi:putative transposase